MGSPAHIPLTLGTAGHVDHGKTKLVEALTGVNTDRLAEARRRGLSIELGFAELDLGDGRSLSVVDVPGHERFIRAMVAGATGIDMFMLVVAADEGVMPQTREHLAVLEALDVSHGVIALTKCDRGEDESRKLARHGAQALLPDARVTEVSAVTGTGLEELRTSLADLAGAVESLPRGTATRVRRVQVHNRDVDLGRPGQRVALNLSGVGPDAVARGDVVVSAGSALRPSYRLDVELSPAGDASVDGERLEVHHGTRAVAARAVGLGAGLAQLRLESPLVARPGDRFVLRGISPVRTIGGGAVLDPAPRRHGPRSSVRERLIAIREHGLDIVLEEEARRRVEADLERHERRAD